MKPEDRWYIQSVRSRVVFGTIEDKSRERSGRGLNLEHAHAHADRKACVDLSLWKSVFLTFMWVSHNKTDNGIGIITVSVRRVIEKDKKN